MTTQRIFLLVLFLLATACEEPFQKQLSSKSSNLIVVEGTITNENINHRVSLSRPYQTQNETPEPVSGAILTLTDGSTSYLLTESPTGSGQYYTPALKAITGKTYTLTIHHQGKDFVAQDTPPPVESMEPLQYFRADTTDYALFLPTSGTNPNFIRHDINWKNTGRCTAGNSCEGEIIFYDLKQLDLNEIFKPDKTDFFFPANSIVIRKRYSLSPAYRTFLRSLLSETEWRGSVFDVQRADVTTNLSEGAIGFFAASTVVSDTTVILKKP
jgi:Domain of unknown function (DUF4249)